MWKDYRNYGWDEIEKKVFDESKLDKNVLEFFDVVWIIYGDKLGYELEVVLYFEELWKNVRKGLGEFEVLNRLISFDDMRNYYKSIYLGD